MRFAAQIVGQCGFAAWGLHGGSFSMCAKVETRSYARGLEWGADLGALCECAARERCGRRLKLIFAGLAGKSAGGVRWSRGARCDCAARERCRRRLKPLFAGLAGKSASDVRGKGAMCD